MKSELTMTALERAVMEKVLSGDDPVLRILRDQLATVTVTKREMTGVGFYTDFALPETVSTLTEQLPHIRADFGFGDVAAEIENLQYGAGFLVWVTGGKLDFLEGYTYQEAWPDVIGEFQLTYFSEPRDMDSLQTHWRNSSS